MIIPPVRLQFVPEKNVPKNSYQKIEAVENTIKTRNFILAKPTKNF